MRDELDQRRCDKLCVKRLRTEHLKRTAVSIDIGVIEPHQVVIDLKIGLFCITQLVDWNGSANDFKVDQ